jgi:predicted ATPase/DNA-binding SARP family transcriptional activator
MVTRFGRQKTGALLAFLAYYPQQSQLRDALIERFWPECDLPTARNRLSVALHSLRRQLEPPGVPAGAIIMADRSTVGLNAAVVATDVTDYEAALQSAAHASSSTERARWLSQAVELYGGELLPGYFEDWVLQERQWLAERYFQALGQLLAHLEQTGDVERALEYARRGVAADPLREEAQRDLIRLLAAAGQPAAALRRYQELKRLFKQELDASPSAATCALAREIAALVEAQAEPSVDEAFVPLLSVTPSARRDVSPPAPLPVGTVTFLMTDIEGSTARWERTGEAFAAALASHHTLLREEFRRHGGVEVKDLGDGFLVAFAGAGDALSCVVASQRALAAHAWPEDVGALRVRMALHTGDVQPQDGDYHGLVLHHAQRVLLTAHGGQIVCSEGTATLVRRELEPGVRLVDLGVYRLRDVSSPERLFQVEYLEMVQREFPPPRAEAGYVSHLPLQFTRFLGREEEIAQLRELLMAPGTRLVTLTGPGGSGKTRLALEVAEGLVEAWRGAVWFVPLEDLQQAWLMGEATRDALGLPPSSAGEPLEQVVGALARQPTLLLLDNFEHLMTEGAPLVRTLLKRVPSLTCFVTSRQRLSLAGEREFHVLPLRTPNGATTPEQLIRFDSVRLFIDRAQAVRPDFQVTPANAAAVAALCNRLDGIPLALELAAARAQVLSPVQMLTHLEQRFAFLVSRRRDSDERHRTLRAALDGSYQLLSPELQQFFARLCVFRGGWRLEAAEVVCQTGGADGTSCRPGSGLVLDYLEQLRECSLVQVEEGPVEMRFRMLETLREYAREQLTSEERTVLERLHAAYYLALAEETEARLTRPEQGAWLDRLEQEHDNLRAALDWAEESGQAERGLQLGGALWRFWYVRGYIAEGRRRLARLLALPGAAGCPAARANVLYGIGMLSYAQGDYQGARLFYQESLSVFRGLGDQQSIAALLTNLGIVTLYERDYETASALYQESLEIQRELGNQRGVVAALNHLGFAALRQSDYRTASALYQEILAIQRALSDQRGVVAALDNLGNLALRQDDFAAARALYQESLALWRALGNKRGIVAALHSLAEVAQEQGDDDAARSLFQEALKVERELDH